MSYAIEERNGIHVLLGISGCRPATEAEVYFAQRCRELEDYIDNHSAVTADYIARLQRTLDERDTLRAEVKLLRSLLTECADYLNINELTSICHGSILHRKMMEASQCATTTGGTPAA